MSMQTFRDRITMLVDNAAKQPQNLLVQNERNGQRGTKDGFRAGAAIVQRAGVCFPIGDEAGS